MTALDLRAEGEIANLRAAIGDSSNHSQLFPGLGKGLHRLIEMIPSVGGGDLGANASGVLGHHGIEESDGVDAVVEESVGKLLREGRIAEHDGGNGVIGTADLKTGL